MYVSLATFCPAPSEIARELVRKMKTSLALVCALLVLGKTAANTCYVCSFTDDYDIDRDKNPKLSALIDNLLSDDNEDCPDNEGISTSECGAYTPCALLRYDVELRLVNTDGTTEKTTISDRFVRRCSPVSTSQVPEGCNDIANYNALFVANIKMRLNQVLGYAYDGEVYADDLEGYYCHYCCDDNSNDADADDVDV